LLDSQYCLPCDEVIELLGDSLSDDVEEENDGGKNSHDSKGDGKGRAVKKEEEKKDDDEIVVVNLIEGMDERSKISNQGEGKDNIKIESVASSSKRHQQIVNLDNLPSNSKVKSNVSKSNDLIDLTNDNADKIVTHPEVVLSDQRSLAMSMLYTT